jgi:hypothetical protein
MKKSTADAIKHTLGWAGTECEVRDEYSGRGMYGDKTAAIVGTQSEIIYVLAETARYLGRMEERAEHEGDCGEAEKASDEFMKDIQRLRWDSMGRDNSVCY